MTVKTLTRESGSIVVGRASKSSKEGPAESNALFWNQVMSRQHAKLTWTEEGIEIIDMKSTHGTRIMRQGVEVYVSTLRGVLLKYDDEIIFGKGVTRPGASLHTLPLRVEVTFVRHLTPKQPQPTSVPSLSYHDFPYSKDSRFSLTQRELLASDQDDDDDDDDKEEIKVKVKKYESDDDEGEQSMDLSEAGSPTVPSPPVLQDVTFTEEEDGDETQTTEEKLYGKLFKDYSDDEEISSSDREAESEDEGEASAAEQSSEDEGAEEPEDEDQDENDDSEDERDEAMPSESEDEGSDQEEEAVSHAVPDLVGEILQAAAKADAAAKKASCDPLEEPRRPAGKIKFLKMETATGVKMLKEWAEQAREEALEEASDDDMEEDPEDKHSEPSSPLFLPNLGEIARSPGTSEDEGSSKDDEEQKEPSSTTMMDAPVAQSSVDAKECASGSDKADVASKGNKPELLQLSLKDMLARPPITADAKGAAAADVRQSRVQSTELEMSASKREKEAVAAVQTDGPSAPSTTKDNTSQTVHKVNLDRSTETRSNSPEQEQAQAFQKTNDRPGAVSEDKAMKFLKRKRAAREEEDEDEDAGTSSDASEFTLRDVSPPRRRRRIRKNDESSFWRSAVKHSAVFMAGAASAVVGLAYMPDEWFDVAENGIATGMEVLARSLAPPAV